MKDYKIYPKQFINDKIPIEKNRCFMLMPFSSNFDYIYGTIKKDLNNNGLICNRADEISGSKPILNKILTEILKSRYIIADLTDYNPNVFYELGIAHSFKDAQNILMIKQKTSQIPFDLTHLTYIEYEPDNLRFLTATIRNFISENQYLSDFHEALNICGITNLISESRERFVDYIQEYFGSRISIITDILNDISNKYTEIELTEFFNDYEALIIHVLNDDRFDLISGLLNVYYNLLVKCNYVKVSEIFVRNFMENLFGAFNDYSEEIVTWKTDLMLVLSKRQKLLKITMPWIIGYFSRSKASSIDLNRYKLESFLMTTESEEINQIIINSLFDSDCHIREHMADIIGEKKLYNANINLIKQLEAEQNYFTVASIMEAIGKIGNFNDIKYILNWVDKNASKVINEHQYFLLKHIYKAICRLDNTPDQKYISNFAANYTEYMNDYIVN
ncbi:MAG: hypothetical protein NC086_03380 [Alistipes sp.]|nr:hypothetical protein [Alistipes sp.]